MLVELLSDESGAEKAARAISRFAGSSLSNQTAVAKAGAIPLLVSLVTSILATGAGRGRRPSLAQAALNNKSFGAGAFAMMSASSSPGTSPVMARRNDPSKALHALKELAAALWSMASGNSANQKEIAKEAGIPPLIEMVAYGHVKLHREAAGALAALAADGASGKLIVEGEGIAPLIALLSTKAASPGGKGENLANPPSEAQDTAASALANLAKSAQLSIAIVEAGGITPLIALFERGTAEARAQAGLALSALTLKNSANQEAIAQGLVRIINPKTRRGSSEGATRRASAESLGGVRRGSVESMGGGGGGRRISNESMTGSMAGSMTASSSGAVTNQLVGETQEHVAGLIRSLCTDGKTPETASFNENRAAVAKAGGIPPLIRQLSLGTDGAQKLSGEALSLIAQCSTELRAQVTQELIGLLGDDSAPVRQRAGSVLRAMSAVPSGGGEGQVVSAELSGGVASLVNLLKEGIEDGRVEAQEYSLWVLSAVSPQPTIRAEIISAACVPTLVACVMSGQLSATAQEQATAVIADLARTIQTHDEIVKAGGVAPLVALLHDGSATSKRLAAHGLARMAVTSKDMQITVVHAGAIIPLLQWLQTGASAEKTPTGTPSTSGGAAGGVKVSGAVGGAKVGSGDISEATGLLDLASRCLDAIASGNGETSVMIAETGVVGYLQPMLDGSRAPEVQCAAIGLLATLAEVNKPSVNEAIGGEGIIPALIPLLGSERSGTQEVAAKALWRISQSDENQLTVAHEGGIPPLVALLETAPEATQIYAAAAVEALARNSVENQNALIKARVVPHLVALLSSNRAAAQDHAVGALLCLASEDGSRASEAVARRLVTVLDAKHASSQSKAASALAELACRSVATRTAIMKAGAIPSLVRLLGDGSRAGDGTPQQLAALVLTDLARSDDSHDVIASAGGIAPLVAMLSSKSERAQTSAASVLWNLSSSETIRAGIVAGGGIAKLVVLLSTGCEEAQRHATAALWPLCDDAPEVMRMIVSAGGITPLVHILLNARVAEAQETASSILAELAENPASAEDTKTQVADALSNDAAGAASLPLDFRQRMGLGGAEV